MKHDTVGDLLGYAVVVAGILTLTRPGSNAAGEVHNLGEGYASILRAAAGTDTVEAQLRLFEDRYIREPDKLPELEAELDRRIGLSRERHHRSWFDQVLGHSKVRERQP